MGGNNEFFKYFERNKYLKKLPSMQRVNIMIDVLICVLCLFQVHWYVRFPLCTVLLLQTIKHVGAVAESGVLRIHGPHVLRILPHARNCVFLRLT